MEIPYTIEDCLLAKQELIRLGLKKEEDFYLHEACYSDGYLEKEPMIKSKDDDCVSALSLYNQFLWSEDDDNNMVDFYIKNEFL